MYTANLKQRIHDLSDFLTVDTFLYRKRLEYLNSIYLFYCSTQPEATSLLDNRSNTYTSKYEKKQTNINWRLVK